jgi:hypothetical protein
MSKTKTLDFVANGTAHGFRAAPSTRIVKANPELFPKLAPAEGLDWFEAEIADDLTIADQKAILTTGPWEPIMRQIAPLIVSWNAAALNQETGEWEELPPPAEAGWEVLERVSQNVSAFLVMCFKFNVGSDLPKGPASSSDTDDGAAAAN